MSRLKEYPVHRCGNFQSHQIDPRVHPRNHAYQPAMCFPFSITGTNSPPYQPLHAGDHRSAHITHRRSTSTLTHPFFPEWEKTTFARRILPFSRHPRARYPATPQGSNPIPIETSSSPRQSTETQTPQTNTIATLNNQGPSPWALSVSQQKTTAPHAVPHPSCQNCITTAFKVPQKLTRNIIIRN